MTGRTLALPWARALDADQLAAFLDDLWGAASGDDGLNTLDAIEKVIEKHSTSSLKCPLSARQIDVLTEIASGETYASAAENLGISVHSVKTTSVDACGKLRSRTSRQACAIAALHGWLPDLRIPQPPDKPRGVSPVDRTGRHVKRAARLRKRPGVERIVADYSARNSAYRAVQHIRTGQLPGYQPAGCFDARADFGDNGRWLVIARFTGAPTTERRAR
jgi:DNA-binding CsgD family transcriptional regulator